MTDLPSNSPPSTTNTLLVNTSTSTNYVQLYNQMNDKLILKLPNSQQVNLVFSDLTENLQQNDVALANIYNKLNGIFQISTDMSLFAPYQTQLVQLSVKICSDINKKLETTNGNLQTIDIVTFVSTALNDVTVFITQQMNLLKTNQTDVKNLIMHYVLSLTILILSTLESANIIKSSDIQPTLAEIDLAVTGLQLVTVVSKANGTCSCVIS